MTQDDDPPAAAPRRSVCLYRRGGRHWWRVDADIAADGTLTVTSGDSNEWQAVVSAAHTPALLAALRRGGDLADAVGGDRDDELLARLLKRFGGGDGGQFEAFKACLDAQDIPWVAHFWAGSDFGEPDEATHAPPAPPTAQNTLAALLREALGLVRREGNDFSWSGWTDAGEAAAEIETHLPPLESGGASDTAALAALFAPAGPMQELAMSSGWAAEFLDLARRIEACTSA